MKNRTPVPRDQRPPVPAFDPVPRRAARHDGWTPDRQRAFIAALADTGSVSIAARQVNMAAEGAYMLRRHPGAAGFRAAWEAALDMGVLRLRDEAFDRAINGQLSPVFVAGKLMGFRRIRNDRLLIFCLRHYGQDAAGRRTRIDYFRRRSEGGTPPVTEEEALRLTASDAHAAHPADSDARVEQADTAAATLAAFEGLPLDAEATRAVAAALAANAARRRADPVDDTGFVHQAEAPAFLGDLEPGSLIAPDPHRPGEPAWTMLDDEASLAAIDAAVASVHAARPLPPPTLPAPAKKRRRRPA